MRTANTIMSRIMLRVIIFERVIRETPRSGVIGTSLFIGPVYEGGGPRAFGPVNRPPGFSG
jgi:hypothetical protein